jgi:hypothetical protein
VSEPATTKYRLLVSFPDDSASFAHGFEAGQIWQRMGDGDLAELELTTHTANREVIRRMADNLGWDVEVLASDIEGWDYTKLVKRRPERQRANPHGLRVV